MPAEDSAPRPNAEARISLVRVSTAVMTTIASRTRSSPPTPPIQLGSTAPMPPLVPPVCSMNTISARSTTSAAFIAASCARRSRPCCSRMRISFSSALNAAPRSTTAKQRDCSSTWRTSGVIERGRPAEESTCALVSASVTVATPSAAEQRDRSVLPGSASAILVFGSLRQVVLLQPASSASSNAAAAARVFVLVMLAIEAAKGVTGVSKRTRRRRRAPCFRARADRSRENQE